MKHLLSVSALSLTFMFVVSCDSTQPGDDSGPGACLEVSPTQRSVASASGLTSFSISNPCDGQLNWEALESCDWISLSNNSGSGSGEFFVDYATNSSVEERTCTITVNATEASGSPKHVTVTQVGQEASPCLVVPQLQIQVWCGSGSTTINVTNPCGGTMHWQASVSCGWVTLSNNSGVNDGTVGVHYSENPNEMGRSCSITVTAPGASGSPYELDIHQEGCGPCGC